MEILAPGQADVYLACEEVPWTVVERLDRAGIRVIGDAPDVAPDEERIRTIMAGCSGLVAVLPAHDRGNSAAAGGPLAALRIGAGLGLPMLVCGGGEGAWSDRLPQITGGAEFQSLEMEASAGNGFEVFRAAAMENSDRIRPYAFLIGRLERDFCHARDAIRSAVENSAGIPCLWSDDGQHRTNIPSVRERTRFLIKHATIVIADLTLGVESPDGENPSRAHEIGMAIAYERPLMLCSQEPRRYPYFSVADMQMTFWLTEDELATGVTEWIRLHRHSVARYVFNERLERPRIASRGFEYDPKRRYIGPHTRRPLAVRRLLATLGLKLP